MTHSFPISFSFFSLFFANLQREKNFWGVFKESLFNSKLYNKFRDFSTLETFAVNLTFSLSKGNFGQVKEIIIIIMFQNLLQDNFTSLYIIIEWKIFNRKQFSILPLSLNSISFLSLSTLNSIPRLFLFNVQNMY